jgi:hypothetical protein
VNRTCLLVAFSLATLSASIARAATVDPSTIPSGTYTVTVVKVIDATHIQVTLDNGNETTLASGRPTVNFSTVQPNDHLKLSIINGTVAVYQDLTSH